MKGPHATPATRRCHGCQAERNWHTVAPDHQTCRACLPTTTEETDR